MRTYKGQRFPCIQNVAHDLREISQNVDGECDVRLQVYPGKEGWVIRVGDSQYDHDHTGFWGASSVPGVNKGRPTRFNSTDVTRDLIEQAKDMYASR